MTEEIKNILSELGYNLKDNGSFFRAKPIYRESNNNTSLSICKKTGHFVDFSANISGRFEDLIKLSLKLPNLDEAKKWLESKIDINVLNNNKLKLKTYKVYPNELLNELLPIHTYWEKRGISIETLQFFRGGLVKRGQMSNRYTFPIFSDRDQIIGFAGRDVLNNFDRPKWKLIGSKLNWVFPNPKSANSDEIFLIESIGDCLSLWEAGIKNTLVLFGVKLGQGRLKYLLKHDIKKIYISLNNDFDKNTNTGLDSSIFLKDKLKNYFDESQIHILLPTKKDFGEMSKHDIKEWYESRSL